MRLGVGDEGVASLMTDVVLLTTLSSHYSSNTRS